MTNALIRDWWEELFQIHEFAHYGDYAADLTRREVDFLMEALGLSGVETILDLACGGGRHAIELTRRGLTVIGVDIVKPLITAAKARAAELDLSIEFVQGDMRELHYEARFDVVLIMNSSLGFFDDATNQAVLAGAVRSLGALAHRLLGTHVLGRAERQSCLREAPRASLLHGQRNAEVGDQCMAVLQQHVFRLDIAMHDAALVRVRECVRHFAGNAHGVTHG